TLGIDRAHRHASEETIAGPSCNGLLGGLHNRLSRESIGGTFTLVGAIVNDRRALINIAPLIAIGLEVLRHAKGINDFLAIRIAQWDRAAVWRDPVFPSTEAVEARNRQSVRSSST